MYAEIELESLRRYLPNILYWNLLSKRLRIVWIKVWLKSICIEKKIIIINIFIIDYMQVWLRINFATY